MNAPLSADLIQVQPAAEFNHSDDLATYSLSALLADLQPLNYSVQNLLAKGYVYSMTGVNNHGKTTLAMQLVSALTKGEDFAGNKTIKGRVLWISGENTYDTLLKCKMYVDKGMLDMPNLTVKPTPLNIAWVDAFIKNENALSILDPYSLVVIDSLQAHASGGNLVENKDAHIIIEALTKLKNLNGNPTILILCHPKKNPDKHDLVPYGGGSIMNAIDGNLTVWKEDDQIKLHHLKLRQPNFKEMYFDLRIHEFEDFQDQWGKKTTSAFLEYTDADKVSEKANDTYNETIRFLKFFDVGNSLKVPSIQAAGDSLFPDMPDPAKRKNKANAVLQRLKNNNYLQKSNRLTSEGKNLLKN
jgi:hypothetical protein